MQEKRTKEDDWTQLPWHGARILSVGEIRTNRSIMADDQTAGQ